MENGQSEYKHILDNTQNHQGSLSVFFLIPVGYYYEGTHVCHGEGERWGKDQCVKASYVSYIKAHVITT